MFVLETFLEDVALEPYTNWL